MAAHGNVEDGPPRNAVDALRRAGFDCFTGIPDGELADLVNALDREELGRGYLLATREDNAVALAAGAWLAGARPLVFMESSGVGTCLDALSSLAATYGVPLVLLIAWEGMGGGGLLHKRALGAPVAEILRGVGVATFELDGNASLEALCACTRAAREAAQREARPAAVLLRPAEAA